MNQDTQPGWEYKPDGGGSSAPGADDQGESRQSHTRRGENVAWEASEFIEHPHGTGWYLALVLSTLALAAIVFLLSTRDIFAAIIVLALGAIVGAFAGHKPSIAKYEIDSTGLSINGKNYNYGDYKSFSIVREGALSSVNLLPLKRFIPPVAAYFDPSDEKKIFDALGDHLPYEDRRMDVVERLSRRLRL